MKVRVTQKAIKDVYKGNIIKVSYCALQHLLNYESPAYYTTRTEGWASDIYIVKDKKGNQYVLSTGYAPFGSINASYDLCNKYDTKAMEIIHGNNKYLDMKEQLNELICEFIAEATKGND